MADAAIQRTFAGGELAPALHARADQTKYVTGLRTCKNFAVLRAGGVANRPGLRFVNECKTNSIGVKLMRYVSEIAGESILIECGVGYFRFYKNGGAVVLEEADAYDVGTEYAIGDVVYDAGAYYYAVAASQGESLGDGAFWAQMGSGGILEIPHPFGNSLANYHQNGRVITLTSGAGVVGPHELIYVSLTKWILRPVTTKPGIEPPATVTSTAGAAGTRTLKYCVTAGAEESYEESIASGVTTLASAADPTVQAPHTVSWDAVEGASEYYVYCDPYGNGTYGFVGTATGQAEFKDVGFTPDFTVTPPLVREPFKDADNYPRQSASYQQRRFFANSINDPDAIWGSRTGFISNFNVSSPLQEDDSVTFKIAANQHNPVRHLVGLKQLIVLTDAGVWALSGGVGQPITPSQLNADQETYVGVSPDVAPVVIGNAVIYLQARGGIICDLRFDQQVEGFSGRDLTIFSSHLFDGYSILDMDFQLVPNSTVWCCRSDGTLLGLTYLRDQEIWGWHRHTTGMAGRIEHVCVVPEHDEDVVYVIVRRTIGGQYHRFIERLEQRNIMDYNADSFFVDAGLSYSGGAARTFSGLEHLEGCKVAVLADGIVMANGHEPDGQGYVVTGGAVTLPGKSDGAGYTVVHIGLPIPAPEFETLDLDVQGTSIRDKRKKIASVALLLDKSSRSFYVGPDADHLMPYKVTPYEGTASPWTGRAEQSVISNFSETGRVLIRHYDPTPLTILAVMPHVEQGG